MTGRRPAPRDSAFRGSIPETYDRYLGPFLFVGYARDLADRVAAGAPGAVLEIAAGTGILTEELATRLPASTHLVATDLNPPMLAVAERKRAAAAPGHGPTVAFRQADAQALPFDDASFDAVVCQFGVMFFPDQALAAREAYRVLRPGGRWLFSVWGAQHDNGFARIAHEVITSCFAANPPDFYRIPCGFSNPALLQDLVRGAGFDDPEIHTLDHTLEAPSARDAAVGLVRGNPGLVAILERGADPDVIVERLALVLAATFGDHPLRTPSRVRVVVTRRPR